MKVCNNPSIDQQRAAWADGRGGGPVHHQISKAKYLARLGWETIETAQDADIVHFHGPIELAGSCDVLTIHAVWPVALFPEHPAFWDEQNHIQAAAMRKARRVVVLSSYTARMCFALAPDVQVTCIPQAFDAEEWQGITSVGWREHLEVDGTPLVIWGKSAPSVLCDPRPVIELARLRPFVTFVLVASSAEITRMTGALPPNVRCVGPQRFTAYQHLLVDCNVYLATTLESSGQGQLEALHLGLPVLGYNWGGVAEVVDDHEQGRLVEPGDVHALAEALDWCLLNQVRTGKASRARAVNYTWCKTAAHYASLYRELREQR